MSSTLNRSRTVALNERDRHDFRGAGQPQGAQAPEVPVVRITPPTRWWVLPLARVRFAGRMGTTVRQSQLTRRQTAISQEPGVVPFRIWRDSRGAFGFYLAVLCLFGCSDLYFLPNSSEF